MVAKYSVFFVVSACGEYRAIAQSRVDWDVYIQTGDDNASRLLASPFGSAIIQ